MSITIFQYEFDLRFLSAFNSLSYFNYILIDNFNNIIGLHKISSIIVDNLGLGRFGNYISDFYSYIVNLGYTWIKINSDNTFSPLNQNNVNDMLTIIVNSIIIGN